ncbi:Fanconi anemia group I protein [Scaptodrosophila lebanonensis]|uniref:Fanconi anemia group I protein n=1 Tax=Drosophila lebanonensis TaxID=7225 RepID=A0A6J2TGW3_DROLE|nr:Fanconi anemia group I protein [Scaptodrosophila lebanonensis]
MSAIAFEVQVLRLGEKQEIYKLQELISNTSIEKLTDTLTSRLPRKDCIFWNYLLLGFDPNNFESREKRFACVRSFLEKLRSVELSYKQSYDLITRLCQDLPTFSTNELGEIVDHCLHDMRIGDAKCVGWKDLLPQTLTVLAVKPRLTMNDIAMTGQEYRDATMRRIFTMRWAAPVLTPLAGMFKEMQLSNEERLTVLNKFAGALQEQTPMELPALCFQLFSMCSSAGQLIIPLLALEKYFHRYYYKRLFADMCNNSSDLDSIDSYSEKELREAEETILFHLNCCTMYTLSEQQLSIMFRNFLHMPEFILTPFMMSAILSMTAANREPDSARLSRSILLPFLRSVIKNNEEERALAKYSVWCRVTLQRKQVDSEQVFQVLIDQNKDGKDMITPGLINLAFVLLKAKQSPTLNALAMTFLSKFIRRRFIFGQGIIDRIAEWMLVDQEQHQFSECLALLSMADTYTMSECGKTIKSVMSHFLWLPGQQSMRMMNFILPLLKLSNSLRDALIEVLRRAINSSDVHTRLMAVYGFCMILKQLNFSNSARQTQGASGYCTQQSISGCSLMTQSTLSNSRNRKYRNFDMLTLEIIGMLRSCFGQSLDIRCTLYENLQRAVELNAKLVPHVLQFVDWHFRSFFDTSPSLEGGDDLDSEFNVRFSLLVEAKDDQHMELQLHDNLGCLVQFVANCLAIFERAPAGYDTREMKRLLNLCIQRIVANRLPLEDNSSSATHLKCVLLQQQMNLIEGLISHLLLSSKQSNDNIRHILPLFKQHQKLTLVLQSMASGAKKLQKRGKLGDTNNTTIANLTVNGVKVQRINMRPDNIWDIAILEKLLHLLHDDNVPFADAEHTTQLRSNVELVRYVLDVTTQKVEQVRLEPDYKQLAYSKRMLKHLTDVTKLIYERCIRRLPELWRNFDFATAVSAANCFFNCLRTANETYQRRFSDFVKGFDMATINKTKETHYIIQDVIDEFMQEDASEQNAEEALSKQSNGIQIPLCLLQSLEILYDHIDYEQRAATESYTWLLQFCRTYELPSGELGIVHRLLFTQRQKTHAAAVFDSVAKQLGRVLGTVCEGTEADDDGDVDETSGGLFLKTISQATAETCLQYLYAALRKQIEDVDYFIVKANNLNYKCNIVPESDRDYWRGNLDSLDRSICTQLIQISQTLQSLTSVCIPLGASIDGLMRLLIQHYNCLSNLTKHCLACCANHTISIKSTKIEFLISVVGRPLPTNVYKLIVYVEANVLDEQASTKRNPQADKAKVLRETRLIPKVILSIEQFNKHIIVLSQKTKDRLANYLHFGTVRDFRFKTADLKAAIERTLSHSNEIQVLDSNLDEQVEDEPDDKEQEVQESDENDSNAEIMEDEEAADEGDGAEDQEKAEDVPPPKSQRRRRVLSNDVEESQPKRRRGRPAKK